MFEQERISHTHSAHRHDAVPEGDFTLRRQKGSVTTYTGVQVNTLQPDTKLPQKLLRAPALSERTENRLVCN